MDKKFLNGLIIKKPNEKAPDFVKCSISIKTDELIAWLNDEGSEWVNIDVKESKQGKWYAEVNTWKPNAESQRPQQSKQSAPEFDDDIPF